MMDIRSIRRHPNGNFTVNGNYGVVVGDEECAYPYSQVIAYLADHLEALVSEPVLPKPTTEKLSADARAVRDLALAASDWTQVADASVDKAVWATYRQALREWPESEGFPDISTIPVMPKDI